MDPQFPVADDLTGELVFPGPDVTWNSWALIPKIAKVEKDYHLAGSLEIYANSTFIGELGEMLLYQFFENRIRGEGFSQIWAFTQLGVESTPDRDIPIEFWTPIFATDNSRWKISEEFCKQHYKSRGWIPYKDAMGYEHSDPLPRKWVRIGVSAGEGQLVTHEPDSLPYVIPRAIRRVRAS